MDDVPTAELAVRFAADLAALGPIERGVGLAVSGGADSLAMLLLAQATLGKALRVATVDHRLRSEAAAEAKLVAAVCAERGIAHDILTVEWGELPTVNIQARAREARYALLGQWALTHGIGAVLTAHHADDQAETLLMRLARGSGVAGLAGARPRTLLVDHGGQRVWLMRPLLGWRRAELREVVSEARIAPVDDPSNRDPRFDRSRLRELLAGSEWGDPLRLAASAGHLADAEEALQFVVDGLVAERVVATGEGLTIDASGLPRELRRRLLIAALEQAGESELRGPSIDRLLATLGVGGSATLGSVKLIGGSPWRIETAPPHRRHC